MPVESLIRNPGMTSTKTIKNRPDIAEADLVELVDLALAESLREGADQAEAAIAIEQGLSVTARNGTVETLEHQNDRSFGITLYRNRCKGSASTADFSPAAIRRAVAKAAFIAAQTEPDSCAGIADEPWLATDPPQLSLDFDWSLSAEDALDVAVSCEAAALNADPAISNTEGASVASGRSVRVYGNSHGFQGTDRRSRHSISCSVIAGSGEHMERDYHYTVARDPSELSSAVDVGAEAARRTLARRDSRSIKTTTAPVVFSADLARGLFGHAAGAMSGGAQYRKSSFLLGAVGEQIFPDWLGWQERPHLDKGLASAAFDAEGVKTVERNLVEAGCFTNYILASYSARRLELQSTGHAGGLHNVDICADGHIATDILAELGTGLLVTELMGQGVNPITGDYSRGAAGFWVEAGRISYPVSEITIAGNLRDMYRDIRVIGDDIDSRGAIRTGSVLVDSMKIAGQ